MKDLTVSQKATLVVAIVDDDESVLRSLECLLESADYATRLFTSGKALLESSDFFEINCVISDIDMPGIDGFELLALLHAERPELPTILITGYPDQLKPLPSLGDAQPPVFTKPFQGRELLAVLSKVLQKSPS